MAVDSSLYEPLPSGIPFLSTTDMGLKPRGVELADMAVPQLRGVKRTVKGPGRHIGSPAAKYTKSIREAIETAFWKAGGVEYLTKVAHRRPDVFLAIVAKGLPTETRLSIAASYQAMPIPVEDRDAPPMIASPAASPELLDAVYREIVEPAQADDDWLGLGDDDSPTLDSSPADM